MTSCQSEQLRGGQTRICQIWGSSLSDGHVCLGGEWTSAGITVVRTIKLHKRRQKLYLDSSFLWKTKKEQTMHLTVLLFCSCWNEYRCSDSPQHASRACCWPLIFSSPTSARLHLLLTISYFYFRPNELKWNTHSAHCYNRIIRFTSLFKHKIIHSIGVKFVHRVTEKLFLSCII